MTVLRPKNAAEVAATLRETNGPVRLIGSGSQQDRLPAAPDAVRIELAGLDAIERFDAGDQTCTVGPGTTLAAIQAAAEAENLGLPCALPQTGTAGNTAGGLFANDPIGALTAGGPTPRSSLLGIDAVLADGAEFRSGARVTKSVAGFDLHKLFVGSRGRLFAVTRLHLRLKPLPRSTRWFRCEPQPIADALARFQTLRGLPAPPAAVHLVRDGNGSPHCRVVGRFEGRESFVNAMHRTHELPPGEPITRLLLTPTPGGEVLAGILRPSRTTDLLALTNDDSAFILHGGGRFELATPNAAASDALLQQLPELGGHATIVAGEPTRRGTGTPIDPGQQRLSEELSRKLDPDGKLV
ncbi:MAG: FAD-binding oxidoreductase [bacterium]|nr:FAD-binding oxidoreductase [bacterium]